MLFQPSNILPDVINGNGNGTIDIVNDGLTVSWQLNGNSPMTAYTINVYSNDVASTLLYTTGNITVSQDAKLPWYPVDYEGNPQRFTSINIPYSSFPSGVTNGNEYKLSIRQYYRDRDNTIKYIDQRSFSVFKTRTKPTVTIASLANNKLTQRSYSFTGTYTQANGDAIAWARWQLYDNTGESDTTTTYENNLLFDSGNLYGVLQLQFVYDGFLSNHIYNLVLTVETENGIQAQKAYKFSAKWTESSIPVTAEATANRTNRQSTAIKVSLDGVSAELEGDSNGYEFIDGSILVYNSLSWTAPGAEMIAETPWYAICKFTIRDPGSEILRIETETGTYALEYDHYTDPETLVHVKGFTLRYTDRSVSPSTDTVIPLTDENYPDFEPEIKVGTICIMVLTPNQARVYYDTMGSGLTPSESLTPTTTLVPSGEKGHNYGLVMADHSFAQSGVTDTMLYGFNLFEYFQLCVDIPATTLNNKLYPLCETVSYTPLDNEMIMPNTAAVSEFENESPNLKLFTINGALYEGFSLFRQTKDGFPALHIADIDTVQVQLYDYGCGSGSDYRYVFYPIGQTRYLTDGIYTRWLTPVFENWSIVCADLTEDGYYRVISEFVFGKNFSSGSVSNNNSPAVQKNFTRYATVQMDNANFQSGTLSGLIGYIGYISYAMQEGDTLTEIANRFGTTVAQIKNDNPEVIIAGKTQVGDIIKVFCPNGVTAYYDDKKLRDDIWALSTTRHHLFLKSRKGDVIEVKIAGEITMSTQDNTPDQALTASIPWVQIGDASRFTLLGGI